MLFIVSFFVPASPGMLIKLDFRDYFMMEGENCMYDYLEVRDGQHGFENLLGRYCGKNFPPEITSKSRYLWLRFHSDESIEDRGFRAVWTMIPRPTYRELNLISSLYLYLLFINLLSDLLIQLNDSILNFLSYPISGGIFLYFIFRLFSTKNRGSQFTAPGNQLSHNLRFQRLTNV